ncbi:hypothetical protein [Demequina mangrovi]|uniref:Restriction endonuclease BglII n=1 Tax=Demequina mangrovi TaxID=1043493 RepID=A0A1H6XAP6_9MICO|nr:hypothetical protein [Demequina mangrovi]SEJ26243.1 hypothetical protein SAMN05421637_1368 [Demequina mangrovi]
MSIPYPLWKHYPLNSIPPEWALEVVDVVNRAELTISTVEGHTGLSSDQVLAALRPGLEGLGFEVESGKGAHQKVRRTVLFGENGRPEVNYDIDAFNDHLGAAIEVEAGRGAANNADYRDIVRTALILDARFLVLMQPQAYRSNPSARPLRAYANSRDQLDAIYASQRLRLPFEGILLIGY